MSQWYVKRENTTCLIVGTEGPVTWFEVRHFIQRHMPDEFEKLSVCLEENSAVDPDVCVRMVGSDSTVGGTRRTVHRCRLC